VTRIAAKKAAMSKGARAIEPGKYTVILEPAAAGTLIDLMVGSMDARSAEEGRSYLSKAGGGTRQGEKLLDERVHLYSDPLHPEVPGSKWTQDGLPQRRIDWFEGGVVRNLRYSRFWARKKELAEDKVALGGGEGNGVASLHFTIQRAPRGSWCPTSKGQFTRLLTSATTFQG